MSGQASERQSVGALKRQGDPLLARVFAGLFGCFLGISLLKFGNPPIMEEWASAPANVYEFVYGYPWPIGWAWWLLGPVAFLGILSADWRRTAPRWLLALPLIWFGWQCVAATQTVDAELTKATLGHFAVCVLCFYLGFFGLGQIERLSTFLIGIFCGFLLMLAVGIDQHFGGLEQYRRYFFQQLYLYPHSHEVPAEFLKRISSNRIFSTLFYPNALAGALLLLLPIMLREAGEWRDRLKIAPRWLVCVAIAVLLIAAAWLYISNSKVGLIWVLVFGLAALLSVPRWFLAGWLGIAALATLYWSGSKGGWLIMLFLGLVALFGFRFNRKLKLILMAAILVAGLAGFFWKYSGFFQKGATSVSARLDYWHAAFQTAKAHPLFGTGPGTFFIPYQAIKRPESESARLVHNDYLEQASDSGVVGAVVYAAFLVGGLTWALKGTIRETTPPEKETASTLPMRAQSGKARASESRSAERVDWLLLTIWLGLLGWALQSLLEFGLYIPALAWPAFALLGCLGQRSAVPPRRGRQRPEQ